MPMMDIPSVLVEEIRDLIVKRTKDGRYFVGARVTFSGEGVIAGRGYDGDDDTVYVKIEDEGHWLPASIVNVIDPPDWGK